MLAVGHTDTSYVSPGRDIAQIILLNSIAAVLEQALTRNQILPGQCKWSG